jgi:hypothetical protein
VENFKINAKLVEAQAENEALNSRVSEVQKEFQDQVAALQQEHETRASEHADAMQLKEQQVEDLQTKLDERTQQVNQLRQEGQREVREMQLDIDRLTNQIASLQEQIRALKPTTFDPEAILTEADGRILRAIPGSEIVYINIGENQLLKIGMGFEVYSQTRETPRGLRGKASLEVVTVMPDTAECRVTRIVPGRPIIEGDLIVNIAYERGRKPKFVVRGDFDLDYDGTVDFDGVEKVKAMIREWGGRVVEELDETTEFLVIGAAPFAPAVRAGETVSPQVWQQIRDKELERSQYRDLIERAETLHIPVLTQSQFLYLTGQVGS